MLKTLIKLPLKAAFLPLKLVLKAAGILDKDPEPSHREPTASPVRPAPAPPRPDTLEIRAQDVLASMLDDKPVFLDVREAGELAASGAIEGAVHMPLRDVPRRFEELKTKGPIVVYCAAGQRSKQAAMFLQEKGFAEARSLTGGLPSWTNAGGAVVDG